MALALNDRVKETTIVTGTGIATLLGSSIGFQPFSVVGNGNTTYYCIADQFGSNWEVGIGTYTASGNTLARTTVLASSNGGALVVFTAGIKDVFVTYPAEKGVWRDASGNAIGLGTPAVFVGTNITGTASGLTAGNVTTNANLTGAITSTGNATSLGSFTSLQLATALTNETGTGSAVFSDNASLLNPTYTGTLTGSTGILNIGSGQVYKDASGNVGIGTSSPYNATTDVLTVRRNQNDITQLLIDNQNVGASSQTRLALEASGGGWYIANQKTGNPLTFSNNVAERMRIDSSGNLLVTSPAGLGYGTGSGGTVTQATSKGTAVTLNKPSGQITMNNAALLPATSISFIFSNSVIGDKDCLITNVYRGGGAFYEAYTVTATLNAGVSVITLKNVSAASLSEAVIISFAIIRGASA
jgi:hypothetical protein